VPSPQSIISVSPSRMMATHESPRSMVGREAEVPRNFTLRLTPKDSNYNYEYTVDSRQLTVDGLRLPRSPNREL